MPLQPRHAPSSPPVPAVRMDAVSLGYADAPPVLRDVNLVLPRGSFHFLTGASGAGKTSLLRVLNLSRRVRAGTLSLLGQDVTRPRPGDIAPLRRRLGQVFQDFRLLEHLSVFDNAALPLRLAGVPSQDYRADVREMLGWVGLAQRADDPPAALSGGEQQRLALARAVINRPELILADEPTGSVDPAMARRLMGLLDALHRQGTTILVATHDEDLAARSGHPVLRLAGGRLTEGTA